MPFSYPDWARWYKKPSYVDVREYANRVGLRAERAERGEPSSRSSSPRSSVDSGRRTGDIPSKLALEKILKNRTCSPMSLYDFYMYLKYIEHSSENLEFYVWYRNYEADRLTAFPDNPRAVTPPDTASFTDSEKSLAKATNDEKFSGMTMAEAEAEERFNFEESEIYARISAFVSPTSGCGKDFCGTLPSNNRPFSLVGKIRADNESEARAVMGGISEMEQARRDELETIKRLYLVPGAPKELNIPSPMRKKVLQAIETSTEAKNLKPVAEHCYLLLKMCSHRNFVRLGVSNGTFETVCMATGLGIVLTVMGFLTMLLLAFVSPGFRQSSRWRGIGVWPMWSIGVGLILSGLRGSCFFLLLFSRRQPLPWERFEEDSATGNEKKRSRFIRLVSKLMIFDRKLKVKDDNLRRLQRKVVMQSLIGGMGFATVMVVVFLSLPIWK